MRKYTGSHYDRLALLHMIGQFQQTVLGAVTTAEVARFMRCSKPTARRYLRQLEADNLIWCEDVDHRPHVSKALWRLRREPFEGFQKSVFYLAYKLYLYDVFDV